MHACFNSSFVNMVFIKSYEACNELTYMSLLCWNHPYVQCTAMVPQVAAIPQQEPLASAAGSSSQVHILQHACISIVHHVLIAVCASCVCHACIMHHTSHITHHVSHRWTTANKENPQRQAVQLLQTSINLVIVELPRQT